MKAQKNRSAAETPAIEMIEEAAALLRSAPASAWFAYAAGTIPFVLALLEFWFHVTQDAFAAENLAAKALAAALAYLWMKCWHAVFAAHLQAVLAGEPPPRWPANRTARLAAVQCTLQPLGLMARPVAMLITIPYGYVHSFFQAVTIRGDGSAGKPSAIAREAMVESKRWAGQNHAGLALLCFFYFLAFFNLVAAGLLAPAMLKSLFGIDSVAATNVWTLLNTTFFLAVSVCAYACTDPLFKAFYALRSFRLRSLASGTDLTVELRRITVAILLCALVPFAIPMASGASEPQSPRSWSREQLDNGIDETLRDPKYAWRMPRQADPDKRGLIDGFFIGVGKTVKGWFAPVWKWAKEKLEWLLRWMRREPPPFRESSDAGWGQWTGPVLYVLCGLIAVVGGLLLLRRLRYRKLPRVEAAVQLVPVMEDLHRDDISADQFPEDEWIALAERMMEQGDHRLAIRALYLALLSHLARRELLRLARHKSDSDYARELRRRAGASGVVGAFGDNLSIFQETWYGDHAATPDVALSFRRNFDMVREC